MKHGRYLFGFIVILALLLHGCNTKMPITKVDRNLSYVYNPGTTPLHPNYVVFHDNEETSLLTAKIFPNELLFNQANPENELRAQFEIKYELFELDEKGEIINRVDTARFKYILKEESTRTRFFSEMNIQARRGQHYLLKIYTVDLQRRLSTQNFIYVNKKDIFSAQNFRVIRPRSNLLMFDPYVVGNVPYNMHYPQPYDSLFVLHYPKEKQLPRPIFFESSPKVLYTRPDSIWKIPNSPFAKHTLEKEGLYFIQADTSVREGVSIMHFGETFPKISSPELMLGPTAYITTSVEFKELSQEKNLKLAIDNFWLKKARNIERARELIRIYYNRVYFANYYFTSHIEGWKTDQGMIFIIYGPPNSLEKEFDRERWIYYKKNTSNPITFSFRRDPNPFTSDIFTLQRSESYNISWRKAVDAWRNGEVFLLDN